VHSFEPILYKGSFQQEGVTYHFNGGNGGVANFLKLLKRLKSIKAGIIVVHGLTTPWQVYMLGKILRNDVRLFVHHHGEKLPGFIKRWLQKKADRVTEAYFFSSAKLAESWLHEGLIGSSEKIIEVMEGSSPFKPGKSNLPIDTRELRFLFVGRLNANKDPLIIVQGFLRFHRECPAARLYMIYQTEELLPQILAMLPSMDSPVILVGKVDHSELEQWYRSASFFIAASHYEGSGIALCEAMSCGCIPIVSNIPSFMSMTNGGSCGLVFGAGNEEEFFMSLQQASVINIPQMREAVLEQFRNRLSFESICRTMLENFKSLLRSYTY